MAEEVEVVKIPTAKSSVLPFQKRKQLERDIEHITAEMYKRNKELADTNKTLSLLGAIDALVLESHTSLKVVSEHITEAIAQATGYDFVGLFSRGFALSSEKLTLTGWSGADWPGKAENRDIGRPLHLKLHHEWFSSPLENVRLLKQTDLKDELAVELMGCTLAELNNLKRQVPIKTVYAIKLISRRRLVGLLAVGFFKPVDQMAEADVKLLDRLSETIGVAIDNKLLFEENQHVLRQLKESNAKLMALDEAKDDFISMASHQLRTPLTSVKGYISMVLEGDTGKVNPTQQQMLKQAFFSSQRMVYLIADLLNVSRLRTGKFLIDSQPVNLAEVVGEEVEQLEETAKSRQLTLKYVRPKTFPELMIDETKTRQVIMNFIDNAIYYTPTGGKITIRLLNKPSTIELRVEDNGIGVPKSEQAHLFTKFYRAGNARKARPDGTGLGLFMAKKVVVAQRGALIFDSHEGKGSTFGFMLSKTKLKVPPKT
jgi:signal transduction histidine kinase